MDLNSANFRMTEFEYWQLPGKALNVVVRPCLRGMLTNQLDFDQDENFLNALNERFPNAETRITFIVKAGTKNELEKYFIKQSERAQIETVEPEVAINGQYPIVLIDDGYTYRPPVGITFNDSYWTRLNTVVKKNNLTIGQLPLSDAPLVTIETEGENSDILENKADKQEIKYTAKNNFQGIHNVHVVNTRQDSQSTAGKLTLKMPTFSPDTESVVEVLDKLEKILPLKGNQNQAVIMNFIQNSGLDHLLLSLTNEELTSFEKFRTAMTKRYSQANSATQFYLISQIMGEHELDLLARIQRAWLRMKGNKSFAETDKGIVAERFISALNDPQIRLKLRELAPAYSEIAEKARQLRLAKEHEENQPSQIKEQLTLLTKEIEKLKLTCKHCGLGHETENCMANQKMKAQFNKAERSERPRQNYKHFKTHIQKAGIRDKYQKVNFPSAIKDQRNWVNYRQNRNNFRRNNMTYNNRSMENNRMNRNQNVYGLYQRNKPNTFKSNNSRYNGNIQNKRNYRPYNRNNNQYTKHNTYFTGVEEPIFEESF